MRSTLAILAAASILAMSPVVARANTMESANTMSSMPAQTQPMILGEVVEMNSHLVTVRAADGELVPLEFDSRTVMAPTIPAGTPVRVTFRLMDNGVHLAQRVTTLEKGSTDWDLYENKLAMAQDQDDIDNANASYDNDHDADDVDAVTASNDDVHHDAVNDHDRDDMKKDATTSTNANDNTTTTSGDQSNTMPSTASPLPMALAIGLMLLACAAGLSWWRRGRA